MQVENSTASKPLNDENECLSFFLDISQLKKIISGDANEQIVSSVLNLFYLFFKKRVMYYTNSVK